MDATIDHIYDDDDDPDYSNNTSTFELALEWTLFADGFESGDASAWSLTVGS